MHGGRQRGAHTGWRRVGCCLVFITFVQITRVLPAVRSNRFSFLFTSCHFHNSNAVQFTLFNEGLVAPRLQWSSCLVSCGKLRSWRHLQLWPAGLNGNDSWLFFLLISSLMTHCTLTQRCFFTFGRCWETASWRKVCSWIHCVHDVKKQVVWSRANVWTALAALRRRC